MVLPLLASIGLPSSDLAYDSGPPAVYYDSQILNHSKWIYNHYQVLNLNFTTVNIVQIMEMNEVETEIEEKFN